MTDQEESEGNVSVVVVDDEDEVASTAKTLANLQEHRRFDGSRSKREQRELVASDDARASTAAAVNDGSDGDAATRTPARQTLRTRLSSNTDHPMLCEICFISFGTFESLEIHFEKYHDKNAVLTVTVRRRCHIFFHRKVKYSLDE